MTSERTERAIELFTIVIDLREKLRAAEAELDSLIQPARSSPTLKVRAPISRKVTASHLRSLKAKSSRTSAKESPRRSPQAGLSTALRKVLNADVGRDFTIDDMMAAAKIDGTRRPSVHAALSRMVSAKKIAKGSQPATYRAISKDARG